MNLITSILCSVALSETSPFLTYDLVPLHTKAQTKLVSAEIDCRTNDLDHSLDCKIRQLLVQPKAKAMMELDENEALYVEQVTGQELRLRWEERQSELTKLDEQLQRMKESYRIFQQIQEQQGLGNSPQTQQTSVVFQKNIQDLEHRFLERKNQQIQQPQQQQGQASWKPRTANYLSHEVAVSLSLVESNQVIQLLDMLPRSQVRKESLKGGGVHLVSSFVCQKSSGELKVDFTSESLLPEPMQLFTN